tara:strand:+ start:169 stop:474 length:306 start_codon:yes stop_codon:yes gene_type:complete
MALNQFQTSEALYALKPDVAWTISDGNITWPSDGGTQPNASELEAEWNANHKHKWARKDEYPDVKNQLDSLYKDIIAEKLDATGEFAKAIKAVKDKHPKGS